MGNCRAGILLARVALIVSMGGGYFIAPATTHADPDQASMPEDIRWTHIEYGAANYGPLKNGQPVSDDQFGVLREAIRRLVAQKGPRGVVFVNDYEKESAVVAAVDARKFALLNGWPELEIRVLAGDYRQMDVPVTDTAHLYHPGLNVFSGDALAFRRLVIRLARRSRTGLEIATYFNLPFEKITNRAGLLYEELGPGPAYLFRSGRRAPESDNTRLYRLLSDQPAPEPILPPEGWGDSVDDFYRPSVLERLRPCIQFNWLQLNK